MRINKVSMVSGDLTGTYAFYSDILGLPVTRNNQQSLSVDIGYSTIQFYYNKNCENAYYHFAFAVPHNLFEQSYEWARQRIRLLPFDGQGHIADFTNWNARSFYFHDNRNNILEFISHFDLPPSPTDTFTIQEINGLSEIGIAVDDVHDTCIALNNAYGIPKYQKGPYTPSFAVMGTDEGLLIISEKGRGWLPTQVQSLPFPLWIEGKTDSRDFTIDFVQ